MMKSKNDFIEKGSTIKSNKIGKKMFMDWDQEFEEDNDNFMGFLNHQQEQNKGKFAEDLDLLSNMRLKEERCKHR